LDTSRWRKALLPGAVGLILIWFLWRVREELPPFLIAFILASLLDPILDRLQNWVRSRGRAVAIVSGALAVFFVAAGIILIPAILGQATNLVVNFQSYYDQASQIVIDITDDPQRTVESWPLPAFAKSYLIEHLQEQQTSIKELISQYSSQFSDALSLLVKKFSQFLANIASKALWLFIIPIVTFYLLYDIDRFRLRIIYLLPDRYKTEIVSVTGQVASVFGNYLQGLLRVCALYMIFIIPIFLLLGLDYSLILGIFAGIMYAVPYVGAIATTVLAALIAWATGSHSMIPVLAHMSKPLFALVVAGTLIVTNQILFDQIVTPRIVGGKVGLHPIFSIFALVVGGKLFGIVGMILAVPLAASIQVVLTHLFPRLSEPIPLPEAMPADSVAPPGQPSRKKKRATRAQPAANPSEAAEEKSANP